MLIKMVNFELVKSLWYNIEKLQLSYLQTEDSPQRIEQKKKLEGCIKEYLSLVHSSERFFFRETKNTLYNSLLHKGNQLSLAKFTQAWEMLSVYASNLLSQPWRKEFQEIRLYSGGYKHQIEQHLNGAEQILMLMGYTVDVHYNRLTMQGVLDPDRIMLVFRDCLLAKVEAQIIGEIYTSLNSQSGLFMLSTIIEYREQYIGTSSQCVKELLYQQQIKDTVMYSYVVSHPTSLKLQKAYSTYPYTMTYGEASAHSHCLSKESFGAYQPKLLLADETDFKQRNSDTFQSKSFHHPGEDPSRFLKPTVQDARKTNIPAFDGNFDIDYLEKMCNDECGSNHSSVKHHGSRSEDMKRIMDQLTSGQSKDDIKQEKNTVAKDISIPHLNKKSKDLLSDTHVDGWECTYCTFANRGDREVCEICFKSRLKGPEVHPLFKGGKECSKCTLVNPRETPHCRACGDPLDDAPTYI